MEIATLIFILSFLAIVATLVVSATRYMCEQKGKVSKRVPLSQKVSITKEQLKELLQNVLDSEAHLIPEISTILDENLFDILFITGIGEVFPYIRSHNVLNNLQSTAKDKPTVLFFPGEYTHSLVSGASLNLFGVLHDDKYYRAFNIFHCEA